MLAAAFADLADTLATEQDVSAALHGLCQSCVEFFDLTAAGVVAGFEQRHWQITACTSTPARGLLGLLARESPEGEVADLVAAGTCGPVELADLMAFGSERARFVAEARERGFARAHLLPMRHNATTYGVLVLFGERGASLTADEVEVAEALASAATAGIAQLVARRRADARVDQLQGALDSRVAIEQAKGVLSKRGGIGVDQAFAALRMYARSHHQPLHGLATRIVTDDPLCHAVLDYHKRRG